MFLVFFLSDRFVPFFSWPWGIALRLLDRQNTNKNTGSTCRHLPDAGHFIVVPLGSISSFVAFFSKLVSLFCVNKC